MEFDETVDHQYSCSKWCQGVSPEEAISNHIKIMKEESVIAQKFLNHKSHPYLTEQPTEETRYIFFPSVSETSKLLIYIHGGFWQQLDIASSSLLANVLVPRFCNYATIGYDLCPTVTLATIVYQVRKALKSLIEQYPQIDDIYLCGHSAGAHLALMSLIFDGYEKDLELSSLERNKIKGLVLISGIYDVRPVCQTKNNLVLNLSVDEAWHLSPIRCIDGLGQFSSTLKVLILVSEFDSPAFQEQSSLLNGLLKGLLEVEYDLVEGKDHFSVFDEIGQEGYSITEKIFEFLGLTSYLESVPYLESQ